MSCRIALACFPFLLAACGGDAPPAPAQSPAGSPAGELTPDQLQKLLPPGTKLAGADPADAAQLPRPDDRPPASDEADRQALKVEVLRAGEGIAIERGQTGRFHYTGMLANGKVFDSSRFAPDSTDDGRRYGEPAEFMLQEGYLIRGWVLGIPGMKVGEKRRLTIPARLGYGEAGSPPKIPGNSTLVFEIELVDVVR